MAQWWHTDLGQAIRFAIIDCQTVATQYPRVELVDAAAAEAGKLVSQCARAHGRTAFAVGRRAFNASQFGS
jgi:hypothetical protein